LIKSRAWGLLFFFLALLAGISRMYLVQHFFEDIYAGAWLGTVLTWLIYELFERKNWLR
jgi:membrane-associated phospholipid phosphatase